MSVSSTFDTWIRCFSPNPEASLRLFCFPYAGGSATIFRLWSKQMLPSVEVCAIQLPGRGDRLKEAPFTEIVPLVQTLTRALRPYMDVPFAFFGHSMGALICFELARQLRSQQEPIPLHLFVSGRRAPQIRDRNPLMHTLPDKEFLAELHHLSGTPEQVLKNPELMQLLLPTLRADFSICGTYTYLSESPLNCPISVFGGLEDTEETYNLLTGWSRQTDSCFSLQMLPGKHFFLYDSQHLILEILAQKLSTIGCVAKSDCLAKKIKL